MKNKIFSLLFVLVASSSVLFAESGTCGENLTWDLTDSVLTISGTGSMTHYSYVSSAPWHSQVMSIKNIIIENGVTTIGRLAFEDSKNLISITIPHSITSIGSEAFDGCTSLASVHISDIAAWCAISFLTLGNPLVYAHNLYLNGELITNLIIPDGVTSIGNYAFSGCSVLTSIEIPNSVTSIGDYAFQNCNSLTSVTIPNGVTSIGDYAFYRCTGLISMTIPNSITRIGRRAFEYCTGLTSVGITDIAAWCAISFGSDNANPLYYAHKLYLNDSQITELVIPENVESIGNYAFINCNSLISVTIPNSVTNIGVSAFYYCTGLTSVHISDIAAWCAITFSSVHANPLYWAHNLYFNDNLITDLIIPNEAIDISNYSFYECSCLTSVTIPNSVINIGSFAFRDCSGLTTVHIGNNVTSIDDYAFQDCSSLTNVSIGNSVASIGNYAFYGCSSLTSVTIPDSVTSIGNYAFLCSALISVFMEAEAPPSLGGNEVFGIRLDTIYVPCGMMDAYKSAQYWSENAYRIVYKPLPFSIQGFTNDTLKGSVTSPKTECDTLEAIPNFGYHFVQWNDSNTNNPRIVELTRDTTFIAEFAKNVYSISYVFDTIMGSVQGLLQAEYLDSVTFEAIPNYGYHFVNWSDGVTDNPRTMQITENSFFTAVFAKNTYNITKQLSPQGCGTVNGKNSAVYLDTVTLTVVPNYGYHFTQWNDSVTDNPRSFVITQDTMFTAELAIDTTGTCGKDYALDWSYDSIAKILSISGDGSFDENIQCGIQAKQSMTQLAVNEGVNSIGDAAFADCETLTTMTLPQSMKTIGNYAFRNCINLISIYNYRINPCLISENTFEGVNKFDCTLYVPESSIDMYKSSGSGWKDFYYILPIETPEGIEDIPTFDDIAPHKVMIDGSVYILRGDKVYTLHGLEVK